MSEPHGAVAPPPPDGISFHVVEDGVNRFRSTPMQSGIVGATRLPGSQIAAETLIIAHRSTGRLPHSLHIHFVTAGDVVNPIIYDMTSVRDGRSTSLRHFTVRQRDDVRALVTVSCSEPPRSADDGDDGDGTQWSEPLSGEHLDPEVPIDLVAPAATSPAMEAYDVRVALQPSAGAKPSVHPFWAKAKRSPGTEPIDHLACIAFVTDIGMSATARAPGTPIYQRLAGASMDHTVWFQRPARADDWMLVSAEAVSFASSRGVAHGTVRTADGTILAVISQESLALKPPPRRSS
ncbi:MAG: acyl-CoA thioesterase [Acidimicrobiia bacterium]